jgi:hypothetical protein
VARYGTVVDADDDDFAMMYSSVTNSTAEVCAHIALHDPARTLREVEATRKMLVRYEFACRQADVNTGAERVAWEKIAGALERDVADRAAVWSNHPDYAAIRNLPSMR